MGVANDSEVAYSFFRLQPFDVLGFLNMAEKFQNVQDVFLNKIRKDKLAVTVFLVNGVKLQGVVTWFDNFSILLRRETHVQLIYKHAVSTIMPNGPLNLNERDDDADVDLDISAED